MKRQMTKTVMLVSVAAALVVSLSACGAKKQPLENAGANNQNQSVSENGDGSNDATTNAGGAGNANNAGEANNPGNAGNTGAAGNAGTGTNSDNASEPATTAPEKTKASISVYYTDDQMIDLHAQKTEIEYADASEKLTATFAALQKDGDKGEGSLWKNAELLSAKQDGDAVTSTSICPMTRDWAHPENSLRSPRSRRRIFNSTTWLPSTFSWTAKRSRA